MKTLLLLKSYQIDTSEPHRFRLFSETEKQNDLQISNKKIKINSSVFSEDEDDDDDEEEEEGQENKDEEKEKEYIAMIPSPISVQSSITPSVSVISLEAAEKLIIILEKTRRGVEQMKNEPSSSGIIPTLCQILDDMMELGLSSQISDSSSVVFLALGLREFQLSSSSILSDDQFLRLVECYVDLSVRPNQYISLFLLGVVLQRVRKLQAPASRLLMRAIEICLTHCLDIFNFFLSRVLTPPSKTDSHRSQRSNEISEEITLHSFQYELVQRIVRQNSYAEKYNLDSLLTQMMTPSETILISTNSLFHLKQMREVNLLLDSLLNDSDLSPLPPLQPDAMTQYLSLCSTNHHHLITPSFPMTQDSLKFLSSIFLSVLFILFPSTHFS
jgi:hypothetical protein